MRKTTNIYIDLINILKVKSKVSKAYINKTYQFK